jgi:hypothetical protein
VLQTSSENKVIITTSWWVHVTNRRWFCPHFDQRFIKVPVVMMNYIVMCPCGMLGVCTSWNPAYSNHGRSILDDVAVVCNTLINQSSTINYWVFGSTCLSLPTHMACQPNWSGSNYWFTCPIHYVVRNRLAAQNLCFGHTPAICKRMQLWYVSVIPTQVWPNL